MINVLSAGYFLGCVVGLIVHEAGHICAARASGLRVKRICLTWRGPYILREAGTPVANIIVSAAGPLVNLVLAALTWRDWPSFAFASLILGLTNFLPTRNSDGSRILREWSALRNPDLSTRPATAPLPLTAPLSGLSLRV